MRNFFNRLSELWANFHPAGKILVILSLVGTVGFFGLKPGYAVVKKWRLERNLVEAKKAVEESRMDEARDLSLTVLRSGDPRVDAYRILEKSTDSLRDPRHGEIARALIFHPESNAEDRLRGFQGIVNSMPLGLVGQVWAGLPEEMRADPRFAIEFAGRLSSAERWTEAAAVLLKVPEESREQSWIILMCEVLVGTGSEEATIEAQRLLASEMEAGKVDLDHVLGVLEKISIVGLNPGSLGSVQESLEAVEGDKEARASMMLVRMDCREEFLLTENDRRGRGRAVERESTGTLGIVPM